jgi:hypothetical protein
MAAIAAVFIIGHVARMLGEDECLKQIIADEKAAGNGPPPAKPTK